MMESVSPTPPAAPPSKVGVLQRTIDWWHIFVLSASAPGFAAAIAFNLIFVVAFVGAGLPFVFIVASIVVVMIANTFVEFSRRLPAAGSAFTYTSIGLGRTTGFLVGWLFAGIYLAVVVAGFLLMGSWLESFSQDYLSFRIVWWIWMLLLGTIALAVSTTGLRRAMQLTTGLLAAEILIILALSVTIVVQGGADGFTLSSLSPSSIPAGTGFSVAALGFVYAFLSYAGFEEGVTLAEEARGRRPAPRGVMLAAVFISVLYIFVAFAVSLGHGTTPTALKAFGGDTAQLQTLTAQYWSSGVVWIMVLGVAASIWAFFIAALNATARVLFAMSRELVLPGWLADLHPRYQTPSRALGSVLLISLAIALPLGALVTGGAAIAYGYVGFVLSLGFLAIYAAVSVALIVFILRWHRDEFRIVRHFVLPVISVVVPAYVIVRLFNPSPGQPYTGIALGMIAFMVIGALVMLRVRTARPDDWHRVGHVLAGQEIADTYEAEATQSGNPERDRGDLDVDIRD